MIKGFRFIGLDIETTGTDPTKHELIQIGIMPFHSWRPIVHDVLPLNNPYQWEQEALDINKFTHERIRNGRMATSIDNELYEDLSTILSGTKDRFVPVGYNVGCLDPSTRVLTDGLRYVAAGDLKPGDGLFTFGETERRLWGRARVVSNREKSKRCFVVALSDGTEIKASEEHPWLVRVKPNKNGKGPLAWKKTTELRAGMHIDRIMPAWESGGNTASWVGGFIDADGSVSHTSKRKNLNVGMYQNEGAVLDFLLNSLTSMGFRTTVKDHGSSEAKQIKVLGGTRENLRLLGMSQPVKALNIDFNQLGGMCGASSDEPLLTINRVTSIGRNPVSLLSTSSGTYVAEGFGMHNSFDMQFFRRCFPKTMQLFSYRTFDLNVLVFTLADVRGKRYDRIKRAAKRAGREYAANQGMPDNAHDAGYDAAVAVGSYNYLTDQVARAYSALQGIRAVAEDVLVP